MCEIIVEVEKPEKLKPGSIFIEAVRGNTSMAVGLFVAVKDYWAFPVIYEIQSLEGWYL